MVKMVETPRMGIPKIPSIRKVVISSCVETSTRSFCFEGPGAGSIKVGLQVLGRGIPEGMGTVGPCTLFSFLTGST